LGEPVEQAEPKEEERVEEPIPAAS
jgi:hypothetical protein